MAFALRNAWIIVALVACGQPTAPAVPAVRTTPRLLPPPPLVDLDAPDAVYRTAVALQLQPSWAQFLEDCRLRLPAAHALNDMSLVATAEISIDAGGGVVDVHVVSSRNADFDRAIRQVIDDAVPLPRPPRALWSDDDLLHVRWQFARDRRQAGPATASVERRDLPIRQVTTRLVASGELARAAQRLRREPASHDRDRAMHELLTAALREALASTDAAARRAAVEAIGRGGVRELAAAVRDLLASSSDIELRIAALEATTRLGDRAAVAIVADQLRADIRDNRRLAVAEVDALVGLAAAAEAATIVRDQLERSGPASVALHAAAHIAVPELAQRLAGWHKSPDARVREAVCDALAQAPAKEAWAGIARGVRDRDATVRASCLAAARARGAVPSDARSVLARIRPLVRDRDAAVRARAVTALATLDPAGRSESGPLHSGPAGTPDLADDRAPEVRAAAAGALAIGQGADAEGRLAPMLDDRDADVRAAAWTAWLALPPGPATNSARASLAVRAATDPAAQVRRAALPALDDDAVLARLASTDDAPEVRTAAIVTLAARRGRGASSDMLLERFAAATPGSAERVRTALAWLLAR